MRYRTFALLTILYLAILFLTVCGWEYYLEDLVVPLFYQGFRPESDSERWTYVVTSTAFAAIALVIPGLMTLRILAAHRQAERIHGRLMAILQATPDMVDISARDGTSIFMNRAAREMMGMGEDEPLSAHRFLDAHTPKARRAIGEIGIPSAIQHGVWIGESELAGQGGELVPVSEVIIAHKDAREEVRFVSTICRDITSQKAIERLKSDFVSIVSHELRTPLTSIQSSLELVASEMAVEMPAEAAEMLSIAKANADRLVRLIGDILDLEKLEYDRLELHLETIDVRHLVQNTLSELRPVASQARVALKFEIDGDYSIEGDRDRLVQVITNLVGNAIKFSQPGDRVEVRATRQPADRVRFSVQDHGPGIHWEHFPKLFGKFQQLSAPPSRLRKGTGLGLAISKAIVEHHGGEIGVESEVGHGSLFYFELPMTQGRETERPVA